MEIYLMQHGPNLSKDEDPEEPLSPNGKKQVSKAARAIKRMGLKFDVIIASPKTRSQQTAVLVAEAAGFPVERIVETEKVKAMTPAEETIAYLAQFDEKESILIAGHLPSLAEIASPQDQRLQFSSKEVALAGSMWKNFPLMMANCAGT